VIVEKAVIEIKPGSEKSFGFVFTCVALIYGLLPLLHELPVRWWSLGVAGVFLLITLTFPKIWKHPNYWWFKLGLFLGAIVAPVVMGLVYYTTVVPLGLGARLFGKDLLSLKQDPTAESYWIERDTPVQSMKNQF